jgi:hypothetical protein
MATSRNQWGLNDCDYMLADIANPFPLNHECYVGGKWWIWVERIRQGQKAEQELIRSITQSMPREDAELYADDYYEAEDISKSMLAALTVAITANIDHFYFCCMKVCECFGKEKVNNDRCFAYNYTWEYFATEICININTISHSDEVLGVRGLQNFFKHGNGVFSSKKNNPIKPELVKNWKLKDKSEIAFREIKFEDIIIAAGIHCNALLKEMRRTFSAEYYG